MSNAFDSAWGVLKADEVGNAFDSAYFSAERRKRRFNERHNNETYDSSDLRAAEAAQRLHQMRVRRKARIERKRKRLERMIRNESNPSLRRLLQKRLDQHNVMAGAVLENINVDSAGNEVDGPISTSPDVTSREKRNAEEDVRSINDKALGALSESARKKVKIRPTGPETRKLMEKRVERLPTPDRVRVQQRLLQRDREGKAPPPKFGANDRFPADNVKEQLGEPQRERLEWTKPGMLARIKNLAGFNLDTEYGERLDQAKQRSMRLQGDEPTSTPGIDESNFDTELHINEIGAILNELNRRAAKRGKEFVPDKETQAYLDHIASVDPRERRDGESYYDAISRLSGAGSRDGDTGAGAGYYRYAATFKDDPENVYKVPQTYGKGSRVPGSDIMDNAIAMALERMGYPFVAERPVKGTGRSDAMLVRQPRAFGVSDFPEQLRQEMGAINQDDDYRSGGTPTQETMLTHGPYGSANEIRNIIRGILEEEDENDPKVAAKLRGLRALLPKVDMDSDESVRVGEEKLQNERMKEIIGRITERSSGNANEDRMSRGKVVGGTERFQNLAQMMNAGDLHSGNLGIRDGKLQVIDPMFQGETISPTEVLPHHPQHFLDLEPRRRKKLNWVGDTSEASSTAMGRAGLSGLLSMLYGSHGEQMMEAASALADKDKGKRIGHLDTYNDDRKGPMNDRNFEAMMNLMRSPALRYRQALESILPYYEESVRDELPGFAESLPDRDFYQPWFDTLLEALEEKQKEKEMLENKDLSNMPGDTPEARRRILRQHESDLEENERQIRGISRQMRDIGGNVDKAIAYKRFMQLLADIKEDPEQSRLFEFANPTSAKFGEAIREAATRPKLSMESVLDQIDHEPLPRRAGESGEPATVVGADRLKRLYDEAIEGLKAYRGEKVDDFEHWSWNNEDPLPPLSERAPDAYEEQAEPRVAEKMLIIYNLLENQYGRNVADNWMSKYGSGSFIETLGAEGFKPHVLPTDETEEYEAGRWNEGSGAVQDYGGVLESHPAWQVADEFLRDKAKREKETPDLDDIRIAQEQIGEKALEDMMANVDDLPPEWREKFKQMGYIPDRAQDIARDQLRDASVNAETLALQEFFKRYSQAAAQEALDSWKAGGELQFDNTGRMIDSPQAVEQAQMFDVPAYYAQDLRNINWPAGMVGVA